MILRDTPPTLPRDTIQSMWIGPQLSVMEQLSIRSFLSHGHSYHLYAYEDVKGVPKGAVVKDANEILPAEDVFVYENGNQLGSPAGFTNRFRYKLLYECGGWWCDTDVVCLAPYVGFKSDYVFAGETRMSGLIRYKTNCAVLRAPKGSWLMRNCYKEATRLGRRVIWGQTGPKLLTRQTYGRWAPLQILQFKNPMHSIQSPRVFHPIDPWEADEILNPEREWDLEGALAVHLWHENWRRLGMDKNKQYHEGCLYEQLKRRYMPKSVA